MSKCAICCVAGDERFSENAAQYLRKNCSVHFEVVISQGANSLLDDVEQCLGYEFVILVLSRTAVPKPWPRENWEAVLGRGVGESGTRIAYALLEDCGFPAVLRRRNCIGFADQSLKGMRALRQWIIQELDTERSAPQIVGDGQESDAPMMLLDEPGICENVTPGGAAWFALNYWREFEGVYWLQCAHLSRASVMGEMACEMKLRLPWLAVRNWAELRKVAAERRALYIFEDLASELDDLLRMGGKASVVVVRDKAVKARASLEELRQMFQDGIGGDNACLRALNAFRTSEERGDWKEEYSVGRVAFEKLKTEERLAEAQEVLIWLAAGARQAGDARALEDMRWEESWILDSWDLAGQEREQVARCEATQLSFPWGDWAGGSHREFAS